MSSGFIHVVACQNFLLSPSDLPLCVCVYTHVYITFCWLIHQWLEAQFLICKLSHVFWEYSLGWTQNCISLPGLLCYPTPGLFWEVSGCLLPQASLFLCLGKHPNLLFIFWSRSSYPHHTQKKLSLLRIFHVPVTTFLPLLFFFFFSFLKIYLLIVLLQLSHSPPTPLHPAHPLPPTFPPIVHVHGSYL